MSADVQHPAWCDSAQCSFEDGGVHNGESLTVTPRSIGWREDYPIEVYPTWAGPDGLPAFPGVYLYVDGEGSLTSAEARQLAAMLVESADALDQEAGG